jgi:hypothetical protein
MAKRFLTKELMRRFRDGKADTDDHNGGLLRVGQWETDTPQELRYNGDIIAIRREREDGSIWFLLNGDDLGSAGWSSGGRGMQESFRRLLEHVPDREDVFIDWSRPMTGAPSQPKSEDFGASPDRNAKWDYAGYNEAYDKWRKEWTYEAYADTGEPVVRRNYERYIIPFSTLRAAGIDPYEITIIEGQKERYIKIKRPKREYIGRIDTVTFGHRGTRSAYRVVPGEFEESEMHLLGSVVFEAPIPVTEEREVDEYRWVYGHQETVKVKRQVPVRDQETGRVVTEMGYFLSGLDESARNPWASYFLARLPRRPENVDHAYEILKPQEVVAMEQHNAQVGDLSLHRLEIQRQGEWFLVEAGQDLQEMLAGYEKRGQKLRKTVTRMVEGWNGQKIPETYKPDTVEFEDGNTKVTLRKNVALPDSSPRGSSHVASWGLELDYEGKKTLFVRGMLTHSRDEHKIIRMGEQWYVPYENTALISWAPENNGRRTRVD